MQKTHALFPVKQEEPVANAQPTFTILGVEVSFPYTPYDCQLAYMESVIRALKAAQRSAVITQQHPTQQQRPPSLGLADGLKEKFAQARAAGQVQGNANTATRLPTIVYSSRTHSQLAQVIRELKATSYRPHTALLGSRAQQCQHPTVSKLSDGAINAACAALVTKHACQWLHPGVERFLRDNPAAVGQPMDIEDLHRLGANHRCCPYYLSREVASDADLVLLPYNYLLDSRIDKPNIRWQNAVIIFDEAHNVEEVCATASSFDISAGVLAACIEEVALAAKMSRERCTLLLERPDLRTANETPEGARQRAEDLLVLRGLLQKLEGGIAAAGPPGARGGGGAGVGASKWSGGAGSGGAGSGGGMSGDGREGGITRPGTFLFELLQERMGVYPHDVHQVAEKLSVAADVLSSDAAEQGQHSTRSRARSYKCSELASSLRLAAQAVDLVGMSDIGTSYRVNIHMEKGTNGFEYPTLSFWCFNPGVAMRWLKQMGTRCLLLTSGTLSPLDSIAAELRLPFPVRLENPHVIDLTRVWVGVVSTGPNGVVFNSNYKMRDRLGYKQDLGYAIANFARVVPDGLLVFFPSYGHLTAALTAWKQPGPGGGVSVWDRIIQHKLPVIEPRDAASFPAAAQDYKDKLNDRTSKGAVFFAVCRGKVSEGIDFIDRAGRAVVITGIPFPPSYDPKVAAKKQVLNGLLRGPRHGGHHQQGLSGEQWYQQQATRAVNQAIGRVIRHVHDYGAILLCDERFREPVQQNALSKWVRGNVQEYATFGAANSALAQFFKAMGAAPTAPTTTTSSLNPAAPSFASHTSTRPRTGKPLHAMGAGHGVQPGVGLHGGVGGGGGDAGLHGLLRGLDLPAAQDCSGLMDIPTGLMDALGTTTGPTTHTTTTHTTTTTMGVADSAPPPRPATHDLHELGNTLTGQTIAVAGGGGTGHGGAGGGSGAFAVTTAGVAAGGAGGAVTAGAASGHTALGSVAAGHTAASGFPSGSSRFSAPVPAPGGGQHAALSMPFHLTAPGPSVGRVASTRALTPDAGVVGGGVVGAGVGGHHGGGTGGGGVGAAAVCVGPPHKVHAWLEVQQHGKQQGKEKRVSGLGEKQGDDEPKRSSIPIGAGMMTDSTGAAGMTTKSTGAGMAKTFLKDLQAALPAALYETVRKAMSSYHKETLTVDALVDQVVDLLTGTPAQHLLPVFGGFLPKRARPQFNLRIASLVPAHAASTTQQQQSTQQQSKQYMTAPPHTTTLGGSSSTSNIRRTMPTHSTASHKRSDENATPTNADGMHGRGLRADSGMRRGPLQGPAANHVHNQGGNQAQASNALQIQYSKRVAGHANSNTHQAGGMRVTPHQSNTPLGQPSAAAAAAARHPGLAANTRTTTTTHGTARPGIQARPGMANPLSNQPQGTKAASKTSSQSRGGVPCPVCKSGAATNPWRAPCGHAACWTCWVQVLSGLKCPSCSAPTRKKQLTKVYFG